MATTADWLEGARLRTLPASLAPVILGTGAAAQVGGFNLVRALLAGGVALALQVGVNFANDYSDGIRGTDEVRTGPPRLTGGGLVPPKTVKAVAFACFAVAAVLGFILVALSGTWPLLAAGAAAILAAWYYTGGKRPYGYMGLGEVFVMIFFGLFATLGTTYTQALTLPWTAWAGAVGVGLIACALLMVNNIRDIPTDTIAGKRTLAVRLGQKHARTAFAVMIYMAIAIAFLCAFASPWTLLVLILLPITKRVVKPVMYGAQGKDLIQVLTSTGRLQLGYSLILGGSLAAVGI